jgi:hypothetical protein
MLSLAASPLWAQVNAGAGPDLLAPHQWHFESALSGALESWNYNGSHEELYGIKEALTYGLRDGLALTMGQRIYYVSQRAQDTWVLGLTIGLRGRVYRRGRLSAFVGFDLGISDAAIAAPPRGTRFNYLAFGGAGIAVRIRRRVALLSEMELIHLSNASLKGPGRNPDIEAIGPSLGLVIELR